MLKSTWIPFTWAQNLNKLEILEEIGTIASQISKKVEFIPRLRSGELSSIFASEKYQILCSGNTRTYHPKLN